MKKRDMFIPGHLGKEPGQARDALGGGGSGIGVEIWIKSSN